MFPVVDGTGDITLIGVPVNVSIDNVRLTAITIITEFRDIAAIEATTLI